MTPPPRPSEDDASALTAEFDALITAAGGDPASSRGRNVREAMHAALKLVRDDATDGEAMLVSRSLKELRYALKVFRPYRGTRKISVFGSARTPENHPDYKAAVDFSRQMAEAGWMVITGAGDGIMRAGHGGAGREASFGVSIRLPFETNANDVIVGDPKLIVFRYFFTRKLMFMWESHAIALFPGGFGTQDEGFEALTLIQTGKAPLMPLVMVDAPGQNYWKQWDAYVRSNLLDNGWISPEDLNLYTVTDDVEAASRHVMEFYRNYHSQRFVGDDLVLRLHRPLTAKQLDALEERFGVLIVSGGLRQSGPLEGEHGEFPDLPRLSFHHTRHGYGHLRAMIDQINVFDAK